MDMRDGTFRIMIVDDDIHNIKVLTEILKDEYKIMAVRDGQSALNTARGNSPPDLILLDIIMEDMDGYEVCRQLKAADKTKGIPIIFVTALSEALDDAKAFQVGGVDFVTKPFHPTTVRARIRTHLELVSTMNELRKALENIKTLSGLLPICSYCKKIRDNEGYWNKLEAYIQSHTTAEFSHSICDDCLEKHFPEVDTE